MQQLVADVMTPEPLVLPANWTVLEAVHVMRELDSGDVIVVDGHRQRAGIMTDRDIVVRAVAAGRDPATTTLADICSRALVALSPTDSAEDAVQVMRQHTLRRLPVLDAGAPVGIVSLGDLAIGRDPDSLLAGISIAPANL